MTLAAIVLSILVRQERPRENPMKTLEVAEAITWIARNSKVKFTFSEGLVSKERRVAVSAEALDPAFAFENGLKLLKSVDIAAVATDVPGLYELVPAAIASKKLSRGYTSVEDLPKVEEFCMLSLHLRNSTPRALQAALMNLVTFPQNCLAEEASGTLILSDFTSNLRRMATLVQQMDIAPPSGAYRITVVILEAVKGGDPDLPEEFKVLDLSKSTGFHRFKKIGETVARLEVGSPRGPLPKVAPPEAVLRVSGPPNLRIELGGSERGREGPSLERFAALLEKPDGSPGPLALQTRLEFRGDGWILVGVAPSESQLTSLVVLARAVTDR